MMKALSDMQSDFGYFGDIRGKGLLIGVELVEDEKKTPSVKKAQRLVKRAIERGLIISRAGRHHNVVKLNPPLMVTMEQAAEAIEILRAAAKDP
jgi:4-aminobutyrate aminotransferase